MSLRSLLKSLNLPSFRHRQGSRQLARLRRGQFFRALPGCEPIEDRRLLATGDLELKFGGWLQRILRPTIFSRIRSARAVIRPSNRVLARSRPWVERLE